MRSYNFSAEISEEEAVKEALIHLAESGDPRILDQKFDNITMSNKHFLGGRVQVHVHYTVDIGHDYKEQVYNEQQNKYEDVTRTSWQTISDDYTDTYEFCVCKDQISLYEQSKISLGAVSEESDQLVKCIENVPEEKYQESPDEYEIDPWLIDKLAKKRAHDDAYDSIKNGDQKKNFSVSYEIRHLNLFCCSIPAYELSYRCVGGTASSLNILALPGAAVFGDTSAPVRNEEAMEDIKKDVNGKIKGFALCSCGLSVLSMVLDFVFRATYGCLFAFLIAMAGYVSFLFLRKWCVKKVLEERKKALNAKLFSIFQRLGMDSLWTKKKNYVGIPRDVKVTTKLTFLVNVCAIVCVVVFFVALWS